MKLHEVKDIAWAAGFLEGEGHFGFHRGAHLSAVQVQREPLERIVKLFGGEIKETNGKGVRQDFHRWQINSGHAVGVMMTLYSFMSPVKKDQVRRTIALWKSAPGKGWRKCKRHCPLGHEYTQENTKTHIFPSGRKSRQCRTCANRSRMASYYKAREVSY